MQTKSCFKCNEVKPISEFYKHKSMSDGTVNKCKECTKKGVRENYRKNIDHYTNYERGRALLPHRVSARDEYAKTQNGIAKSNNAKRSYIVRNPIQRIASHAVNNAIKNGRLKKPDECQSCGKTGRIHGHHCDYLKPLDVMWLCPACHMKWHKENGRGENCDE